LTRFLVKGDPNLASPLGKPIPAATGPTEARAHRRSLFALIAHGTAHLASRGERKFQW
jgi:hypothetical protein